MASIFLSYDRDDGAKARPIAAAFEKTGHSVWWDKHIGGGTEYAKEIEQALSSADIVVVLWSSSSIDSPWVRDEAGSGRDSGRLVPLSINGTPPPLGFRQFQSIDLGRWPGRGKVPRLKEILAAIERQANEPGIPASAPAAAVSRRRDGPSLNTWALIGASIGLFFVIVGLLIGRPWEIATSAQIPTVGIVPANKSAGSEALAHALHSNLSTLGDIGSGKWQLIAPGAAGQRSDFLFQIGDASSNNRSKSTLTLVGGKDRSVLWSRNFDLPGASSADLQQQASLTAGRVLGCAVEGLNAGGKALRRQTLKLYLTGCSQLPEALLETYPSVAQVLEQVVSQAPAFKAGWSKLLLAESEGNVSLDDPSMERQALERHVKQASQLDPNLPEVAVARAALLPRKSYGEALQLLDDAHARSPESANVLTARSGALMRVGRLNDAIADARQATQLDPTSPDVLSNYVLTLAYAGRIEAAREQLQRAKSLWAGTGRLSDLEYAFQLRFGDPKDLLNTEEFKQAPPAWQMYVRTRINPSSANVDRFVDFLRQLHARRGVHAGDVVGHSQAYGEFHREDDLYEMLSHVPPSEDISLFSDVVFRPALHKFRQDPRFMIVANRIGLVDYWQKSGKWPDFCFVDPDQPYDCKAEAAKLTAA